MGKLHTLRRAILRDPAKWAWPHSDTWVASAYPDARGQWQPCFGSLFGGSYNHFVKRTLTTLRGSSSAGQTRKR